MFKFGSLPFVCALLIAPAAQAISTSQAFEGSIDGARCYERQYTRQEINSHPKQTVTWIAAQLRLLNTATDSGSIQQPLLDIAVKLKNEPGAVYGQTLSCRDSKDAKTDAETVLCMVDCDGGTVEVAAISNGKLQLKNDGVIVSGGCGSEKKTRFLKAIRGGDDIFMLHETGSTTCQDIEKLAD